MESCWIREETHSHCIVWLDATCSLLSGTDQTLHFVHENTHKRVTPILEHRFDILEEFANPLSAFTEEFAKERVGIDFYQLHLSVLFTKPYRQLLCQGTTAEIRHSTQNQ